MEFLVQDDDTIAFAEVNPRLQVEHTVTEQVTGLDLVELGLRVADGATLSALALPALGALAPTALARGVAIQVRVNAETLRPDGTFGPGTGTLSRFQPPAGRGVRVDTAGYPGYTVSPHYDSLLAKVITDGGTLEEAARRALRALAEFDIAGVPTNVALLQALLRAVLQAPGPGVFEVGWVDAHVAELVAASPIAAVPAAADGRRGAGAAGRHRGFGHDRAREPGRPRRRTARHRGDEDGARGAGPAAGLVREVAVTAGATVQAGAVLVVLEESADDAAQPARAATSPWITSARISRRCGSGTGSGSTRAGRR